MSGLKPRPPRHLCETPSAADKFQRVASYAREIARIRSEADLMERHEGDLARWRSFHELLRTKRPQGARQDQPIFAYFLRGIRCDILQRAAHQSDCIGVLFVDRLDAK